MANNKLDLIGYDGYNVESIGCTDEDLMRVVYDALPFPFLESLKLSDRMMTCLVDKDDDYQRVKVGGLTSTLDLVALRLVLVGQPLSPFEEFVAADLPSIDPRAEEPPMAGAELDDNH